MLKSKKLILAVMVGAICLTTLWFAIPRQPCIILTCLYTTNEVVTVLLRPGDTYKTNMVMGVFRLENNSGETIMALGFFQNERERGLEAQVGDYGAPTLRGSREAEVPRGEVPRGVSTFESPIPPHDGKYRLVLRCVPHSKSTLSFMRGLRFRLAAFVSFLPKCQGLALRLSGSEFAFSQWIQVPPPDNTQPPPGGASVSNSPHTSGAAELWP